MFLLLFNTPGLVTSIAVAVGSSTCLASGSAIGPSTSVGVSVGNSAVESVAGTAAILTVEGTIVGARSGTIIITETANGPNSFSCNIDSLTGVRTVFIGDDIVMVEGGVRAFGGTVTSAEESAMTENAVGPAFTTRVEATDYNKLTAQRSVNETRPSETLLARLQYLTPIYLGDYGVTLDPTQAVGPTLPAVTYQDRRFDEVLNETTKLSAASDPGGNGYLWNVSYYKVLKMALPASFVAPVNAIDGNGVVLGDIVVEPSKIEYANYIIVRFGQGQKVITDLFTGDGVTSTFQLTMPLLFSVGYVTNNPTTGTPPDVNETLAIEGTGFDMAAYWLYNPAANTARRVSSVGPPLAGNTIRVQYLAQFPGRATADGGALPVDRVDAVYEEPDVYDLAIAQPLAENYLSRAAANYRIVKYPTFSRGLHPGQSQLIQSVKRNLNSTCLITDVRKMHVEGAIFMHEIGAIEGTVFQGSWRDDMRSWGGGTVGSGGGGSAITIMQGQRQSYFLGGNLLLYVQWESPPLAATPGWIDADAIKIWLDTAARGSVTATVNIDLRASSGTVQARLQNVEDDITVGTGPVVSNTAWTDGSFTVTLTSGRKPYKLQLLPSLINTDVAGTGYVE